MNLRDLEYLVAVAKYRHFHQAAEACFVSQPTLSGQIKKLEQHLGVCLIERGRKQKVMMTAIGQQVVERAELILQEAHQIEQISKLAHDPFSGALHLALIPTLAPYLLPYVVPVLKENWPQLELMLHELQTAVLLDRLAKGEIELGVLALPIESEEFKTIPLFEEPFYLAMPPQHPLAKQKKIAIQSLQDETMLLLDDGHCFRDQALEVCFQGGAHEKTSFRGTSLETLKQMVIAGSGLTLLPQLAIGKESKEIKYKAFQSPEPVRVMGLVYRSNSPREKVFIEMGRRIQDAVVSLGLRKIAG